jgi:hypothetical protein
MATRGAPKMVTRSALSVRHEYHATGIQLTVAHGLVRYGCAAGNLVYALRVRFENSKKLKKSFFFENYKILNNVLSLCMIMAVIALLVGRS